MNLDLSEGTVCRECGRKFPESEMIVFAGGWVCSGCKQDYFQKLREGVEPTETAIAPSADLTPAGPAIRTGGYLIDWLLFSVLQVIAIFVLAIPLAMSDREITDEQLDIPVKALALLIALGYLTLTTWLWGAPLGARMVGLRVVTDEGKKPGLLRALRRSVLFMFGTMICFLAPLSVLSSGNLGIHDKLSGTRVIRKKKSG